MAADARWAPCVYARRVAMRDHRRRRTLFSVAAPDHDRPPPTPRSAAGRPRGDSVALYRLAFEESRRTLDDQIDEVNGIRQRVSQYLAFVGTASAFLVGTGLGHGNRTGTFYAIAITGSIVSLCALSAGLRVLLMWEGAVPHGKYHTWRFRLSANKLMHWIEPDVPQPDETDLLRALALRHDEMAEHNDDNLDRLRHAYAWCVGLGFVQLLVWGALAWANG